MLNKVKICILLLSYLLFSQVSLGGTFTPTPGKFCHGFPQIDGFKLNTEDKCLGLALPASQKIPWSMPRRLVFQNDDVVFVSDLGKNWKEGTGAVWRIDLKSQNFQKVYTGGNLTHGLAFDQRGRLIIGDKDKILRLHINSGIIEHIILNLPDKGSHPLSHFILLPNGDLVVNVGAPSDDCSDEMEESNSGFHCESRDSQARLHLYKYDTSTDLYSKTSEVIATGLRNSMALAYNPFLGEIYQAENNIDHKGVTEEFNLIPYKPKETPDFGWPFCYGTKGITNFSHLKHSTFKKFCLNTQTKPFFLIPPHSAPLDMMYYKNDENIMHQELRNKLLMSWHGYRKIKNHKHALVAYNTNSELRPIQKSSYISLIEESSTGSSQPKIRPVGMALNSKGAIFFLDDKNSALLVYATGRNGSLKPNDTDQELNNFINNIPNDELLIFDKIYSDFYKINTCTSCHENIVTNQPREALFLFLKNGWFNSNVNVEEMPFFNRLSKDNQRFMPLGGNQAFEMSYPLIYKKIKIWVLNNFKTPQP